MTMYRIKYVTATGVWYTPPYEDELILHQWVKYLQNKLCSPHYVVAYSDTD